MFENSEIRHSLRQVIGARAVGQGIADEPASGRD
jgi:hypothetical protein